MRFSRPPFAKANTFAKSRACPLLPPARRATIRQSLEQRSRHLPPVRPAEALRSGLDGRPDQRTEVLHRRANHPRGSKHHRRPGKKIDCLLAYKPDFPIAVVEAKADYKLPGDGQQSMAYAEILDLRFAYSTNGHGIVEHDFTTGKQSELSLFPSPELLWKRLRGVAIPADEKAAEDLIFPFNRELRNPDGSVKTPRYFQAIAINRAVRAALEGKKRILLTMATGTGGWECSCGQEGGSLSQLGVGGRTPFGIMIDTCLIRIETTSCTRS